MMPFRFICGRCSAVLFECEDLEPIIKADSKRGEKQSPVENFITHNVGTACPKCGKPLQFPPLNIEVYPSPATLHKSRFKHDYHKRRVH
jgi:ribosomal protein S27AE